MYASSFDDMMEKASGIGKLLAQSRIYSSRLDNG